MVKENFDKNASYVISALTDFLDKCDDKNQRVITQPPLGELVDDLNLETLIKNGNLSGKKLKNFVSEYLESATRLHHPHYMAHQVSIPHTTGALASMIDGLTNNAMAIYEMGPGAAAIEFFMINWMLEKIGWETAPFPGQNNQGDTVHGWGVMTHGGSLANLTAMLAARNAQFPDIWRNGYPGNIVVLVPEQSHYSLKRTVAILGLGEKNCIKMPADEDGRVLPEEIPSLIQKLTDDGKQVMAIVGNACGTAAGLYDPLDKIAAICQQYNIWFHVDAAHGAGAIVCEEYRHLVKGIEMADSVIWDAHKMFRTPILCAAVLVKNHDHIDRTFTQQASYLVHEKEQFGIDQIMRTVECTKSGLGLKMFMSIAALGEKGLCEYITSRTKIAVQAAEYINTLDDFECPVIPETNILCFRIGNNDSKQLEIRKKLLQEGKFYISTTEYKGIRWLRCVIINPDTSLDDIKNLLDEVRNINEAL